MNIQTFQVTLSSGEKLMISAARLGIEDGALVFQNPDRELIMMVAPGVWVTCALVPKSDLPTAP